MKQQQQDVPFTLRGNLYKYLCRYFPQFILSFGGWPKERSLTVGDPYKKGVEQGPQIDSDQFNKILKYIRSGIDNNAFLECGGERYGSKGYFIQPTVFSDVQDDMLIAKDEVFGPVQTISKFKDIGEVIQRANKTHYALAAGVFTRDANTSYTLSRALKAGTVWVNCFDVFNAAIPFGRYEMSGVGREKHMNNLNNYPQEKVVITPLINNNVKKLPILVLLALLGTTCNYAIYGGPF